MSYAGRFAGRTAIVTGGASGLGKCAAQRIIQEGGRVSLWDLNAEALAAAAAEIGAAHFVAVDVSDADAVSAAAAEANTALDKIDILIASAGITGATVPVHEFPIDSWKRVVDINLNGVFYCARAVVPYMLQNGYGRIVNVASVAGKEGNPNASAYSAPSARPRRPQGSGRSTFSCFFRLGCSLVPTSIPRPRRNPAAARSGSNGEARLQLGP